jgi:hypothetical protein
MSGADGQPDRRVDLDELFESMCRYGMRDPLVLGIGTQSKKIRLETGNQRIYCLQNHGVPFVPVIAYVSETAITNPDNGAHQGLACDINLTLAQNSLHRYAQPTLLIPALLQRAMLFPVSYML